MTIQLHVTLCNKVQLHFCNLSFRLSKQNT